MLCDDQSRPVKRIDCRKLCADDGCWLAPRTLAGAWDWSLCGTSPCSKRLWQIVGGYRDKYSYTCQDMDFWMRALTAGAKGIYTGDTIYNWCRSPSGMNASVPTDVWRRVRTDNTAFFERYAAWRVAVKWLSEAQRWERFRPYAWNMIRRGILHPRLLVLASLPAAFYPLYFHWRNRRVRAAGQMRR